MGKTGHYANKCDKEIEDQPTHLQQSDHTHGEQVEEEQEEQGPEENPTSLLMAVLESGELDNTANTDIIFSQNLMKTTINCPTSITNQQREGEPQNQSTYDPLLTFECFSS